MLFCRECYLFLWNGHCAHIDCDTADRADDILAHHRRLWAQRLLAVPAKARGK